MYLAPGTYRQIIHHQDGGVTIDLIGDEPIGNIQPQVVREKGQSLQSIWRTDDITFESFIQTLRNQGRVSQHGMRWQGTGTHLRALMDFLTENEFIQKVSRPRFIELAKNTFQISKLKDRSSLNTISWKQYDREMVFLQKSFFGA